MPPDENDRLDEIWRDDLFEREPDASFLIDFLVAKIGERKERSLLLTLSELIGLGPITFLFTIPLARFIAVDRSSQNCGDGNLWRGCNHGNERRDKGGGSRRSSGEFVGEQPFGEAVEHAPSAPEIGPWRQFAHRAKRHEMVRGNRPAILHARDRGLVDPDPLGKLG